MKGGKGGKGRERKKEHKCLLKEGVERKEIKGEN